MKFIAFWEYAREDTDKLIPKFMKVVEARKKTPEKLAKVLFPPHHLNEPSQTGNMRGITILETDDEEKVIDYTLSYFPEMTFKIVPLNDSGKVVELYLKMKKG